MYDAIVLNSKYATYEDIFTKFVAPKLTELLGISDDEPVLLYHQEHSKYDIKRTPSVQDVLNGLTFFVMTKTSLNDYITALNEIKKYNRTLTNNDKDNNYFIISFYNQLSATLSDEKNGIDWFKKYAALINSNEFIINSGTSTSNNNELSIISFKKFIDPTQSSSVAINWYDNENFYERLKNIYIDHVLKYNIDSILVPVVLNNVDVFNITKIYESKNSLVRLSDIEEIGIFEIEVAGKNKPEFESYDYNEYIALSEITEDIIEKGITENSFNHLKNFDNIFTITSKYCKTYPEELVFSLISTSVSSSQDIDANIRLDEEDLTTQKGIMSTVSSWNNKYTFVNKNLSSTILTVKQPDNENVSPASEENAETSPNKAKALTTVVGGTIQNNILNLGSAIIQTKSNPLPVLPSTMSVTVAGWKQSQTGGNSVNMQKNQLIIGDGQKVTLDDMKYQDTSEILEEAGAYIIPCYNIDNTYKIGKPLNNNQAIMPSTMNSFLPVFNGPNLGPGKRCAIFGFKQGKTDIEYQTVIEQKGVPVEIEIIPQQINHNGGTLQPEIFIQNIEFLDINLKNINDNEIFNYNIYLEDTNLKKVNINIYYNSYNFVIPQSLAYIVINVYWNNSEPVGTITKLPVNFKVSYNGITTSLQDYERYVYLNRKNPLNNDNIENAEIFKNWKENKTQFNTNTYQPGEVVPGITGNQEEYAKFLGYIPTIWEQNKVFIILKCDNNKIPRN